MSKNKNKKVSIREFVSEEELKFNIYFLKYSSMLKDIRNKTQEEIFDKTNAERQKRIKSISRDLEKAIKDKNETEIASLEKNLEYIQTLKSHYTEKDIFKMFEEQKSLFISFLNNKIEETNQNKYKEILEYVEKTELTENASKEKFGVMLMLIIKNLGTMPSFSGYTENWKTDFYSNAVEKTLLYIHNFDENLLSKRTGGKSKAFAYITQICFNAFVNVINIRKKEESFLKDEISSAAAKTEGVRNNFKFEHIDTLEEKNKLVIQLDGKDNIKDVIESNIKYIKHSNKNLEERENIQYEIDTLADIPEKNTVDYNDYIEYLKSSMPPLIEDVKINELSIIKENEEDIIDFDISDYSDDNLNISIVSPINKDSNKKVKEVKEEIPNIEDVFDEW